MSHTVYSTEYCTDSLAHTGIVITELFVTTSYNVSARKTKYLVMLKIVQKNEQYYDQWTDQKNYTY